ncbi:glycoside hydrolase family 2 TIM barrel-domain containing protein [Crossiella sp. CA-258035]|uniref:glycoside hydrolase family 2 TIM barrel-domain containing protein n=1 Tax=Crossiella sp. CA-258035 TaxID=2981138 RepID=UPI0024BCA50F|nr:glycoside hydrolase family 2 TIM barrel-domain containing protein [Crossiella sp. CA-258035]WHT16426.1 glycoside hydrolase family 2 TIM barrel-domain containing protein [Crossiella sp. CA-258035]
MSKPRARRSWSLLLGCGMLAGLLSAPAVAEPAAAEQIKPAGRTVDFTGGWQFSLVNTTGAEAPQPGAGDPSWRNVRLPHDWSIGLNPVQNAHTTAGTAFLPGGLGWYRKTFTLPPTVAGKKVAVEFDGVYMDAEVYLNGKLIGRHPYGYTGFALDLTPHAHTNGTPDLLSVRARNQIPSSRWYSGSGIYRDVRLTVTDPVHITRHGVTVTTPDLANTIGSGFATMRVQTSAVSENSPAQAEIVATVKDATGKVVGQGTTRAELAAQPRTASTDVRIEQPVLWSAERPHLYTVDTEVRVGGKTVDTVSTRTGIRYFAFHPDNGFSLNGKKSKLKGVNLHHDLGALGSAVSKDAIVRQLQIMKSMGVNAVRTSHNPPAPEFIQACEEMGLLLQIEAFDTWRTPKTQFDYGRFFDAHSSADIREMVHAAKNSPSVVMWSIGNEIPDSTAAIGVPIAKRLIADVRAVDATRPIVMGSDKYRRVPAAGSPQDEIMKLLDGMGLNYNTAASTDALHAAYPTKFFFESESSSSTSTRGHYQDPDQLNTGENFTPGRRNTSSYDNNLETWTYSGEYGLKKDRDRKWFAGQFLWTGIDYLGEPTPYNVFPVKASFFGAVDTAGFAKDFYHLFRSQWTTEPMVHLLPMNWTDHKPGDPVSVWAYSNADTVELLLNGKSLGERKFDTKTTVDGTRYLETTEATGDDKTVTSGRFPGSYTSPNGSAGKLHLTWSVPFQPGRLVAVAKRGGTEVARDELRTAGTPHAIKLTPDRKTTKADGKSHTFVTAEVVDEAGVVVPGADNLISFRVNGGSLAGLDNGRQESAENYQAGSRTAFNGKALAIVRSGQTSPVMQVTASAPGLRSGTAIVAATGASPGAAEPELPAAPTDVAAAPAADASYSGRADTLPAAMLDGNPATAWSNYYLKRATALLPEVSRAHQREWVSVSTSGTGRTGSVAASFVTDAAHALPASIGVSYWDGRAFVPVRNARIEWATGSGQPTRVTFDPVRTGHIRLDLTSRAPGTGRGFLRIAEVVAGR